jgi:hypothetical protein
LTYLERQKCYGPDKKILFKKQLFDLDWPWGQRSRSHKGHYGMRHTALWSCTHILEWYYLKNNYLTLGQKKKYVCLRSPDPPYFSAADPNLFNQQLFHPNFC